MREFILEKLAIESMTSGELTACVVYQMKYKPIRGLFWKVKSLLDTMIKERIIYQKDQNYYIK